MARKFGKVVGVQKVQDNLAKVRDMTRANTLKGLLVGGSKVRRDSMQNVPVRQGNLRASAYVAWASGDEDSGQGFKGKDAGQAESDHQDVLGNSKGSAATRGGKNGVVVVVGHTARYAAKVHENPNAGTAGYDPEKDKEGLPAPRVHSRVGGWKFLENALKNNIALIRRELARATRLPGGKI